MPKLRKPPPKGTMDHLIQRFRDGRIPAEAFIELKQWIDADPDVPEEMWFKRFKNFVLVGTGELPSTFLTPGMAVKGKEVM